jgi:hypothetical protein
VPLRLTPTLMPEMREMREMRDPGGVCGPDNVMDYRFVSEYTLFLRVRSSQSGIPSH